MLINFGFCITYIDSYFQVGIYMKNMPIIFLKKYTDMLLVICIFFANFLCVEEMSVVRNILIIYFFS